MIDVVFVFVVVLRVPRRAGLEVEERFDSRIVVISVVGIVTILRRYGIIILLFSFVVTAGRSMLALPGVVGSLHNPCRQVGAPLLV